MTTSKFEMLIRRYELLLNEEGPPPPKPDLNTKDAALPPSFGDVDPDESKLPGSDKLNDPGEDTSRIEEKIVNLRNLRRALLITLSDAADEQALSDLGSINESDIEKAEKVIFGIIDKYTASELDI